MLVFSVVPEYAELKSSNSFITFFQVVRLIELSLNFFSFLLKLGLKWTLLLACTVDRFRLKKRKKKKKKDSF